MIILGIDTTTKFLALGIYAHGKVYEYNVELGRKNSALLMTTIVRVLDVLKLKLSSVDYFACGIGPGSFTGIRLGVATMKGICWSLNKPFIAISTLEIMAYSALFCRQSQGRRIFPIIDAKRNLIFTSAYKKSGQTLKRVMPYKLLTIADLLNKFTEHSVILGDAVVLYKHEFLMQKKDAIILDSDYWYPDGRNIISLALHKIEKRQICDAARVKPIYLYPKECQIRLQVKN